MLKGSSRPPSSNHKQHTCQGWSQKMWWFDPAQGGIDAPAFYSNKKMDDFYCCYQHMEDLEELLLIDQFVKTAKPILGICRGMQMLQLYFGVNWRQLLICLHIKKIIVIKLSFPLTAIFINYIQNLWKWIVIIISELWNAVRCYVSMRIVKMGRLRHFTIEIYLFMVSSGIRSWWTGIESSLPSCQSFTA